MKKGALVIVLIVAMLGLLGFNLVIDRAGIEMVYKPACREAGYDGWVRINGAGYCWQATEGVPVLVKEVQ